MLYEDWKKSDNKAEDFLKLNKEELIKWLYDNNGSTKAFNIMGCNESWYNECYSITQVFSKEELSNMTEKEIRNLVKLAETIEEYLY